MRNKVRILTSTMILNAVVACNGGGGSSGNTPPTPQSSTNNSMLPLNISVSDLSNNPLPNDTIDVYKIGQVTKYKLTFTNPNSFAVSMPLDGGINSGARLSTDVNWADANNKLSQPGNGSVSGSFYKTNNADDCFNFSQLNSGQSCSFYSIAQYAFNTTSQENFSYPIAYVINQISEPSNKLIVQQCQKRYPGAVPQYDCSNEQKPGYANQFIKYKLVSTTTSFPYPTNQGYQFSNDGNYLAYCTQNLSTVCYKQSVTYSSVNNSLSFSPFSSFKPGGTAYGAGWGLISANGTSFFGTIIKDGEIYYTILDSTTPNSPSHSSVGTNSLSDIEEIQGLDNSIIVNNTGAGRAYKYDASTNTIPDIKVDGNFASYVYGVTSDGTIITEDRNHNLRCANSTDGINYTSRSMTNFVLPTSYADYVHNMNNNSQRAFNIHNVFYGYQDFAQTNASGKQYIKQGAFLKINADTSHCSIAIADANTINPNDITFDYGVSVFDYYVNIGSKLTSVNNTVLGFK